MITKLLKLYPRAWRARYEDELGELVANQAVTPRLLADLLRGILDAHLHPQLVAPSFAGAARSLPVPIVPTVVLAAAFVVLALSLRPSGVASSLNSVTRAPSVADPGRVLEFVSYDDPTYGYRLAVPKNAQRERTSDGRSALFTYRDDRVGFGTFTIRLTVVPIETGTTPERLLLTQTEGVRQASPPSPITADGDRIVGAALSYAVEPSAICSVRRASAAAFVWGRDGYVIRIESDAAGRCDAERMPQTRPVIESLRLRERRS
jgi:hypothetical protein